MVSGGRMRELGLRPRRRLGQTFLADPNILGVIERAAELHQDDVVLEIGGGLGVLSAHLAPRVGHLHVVELDPRLEAPLREILAPFANTTLHVADAMTLDFAALRPVPVKVVANLPYGIAASAIIRTITELEAVELWVAMVQREVGERFAAQPGSGTYGIPSVLAQLACEVRVLRAIPRTVFRPVPRVDSVLLGLRRRGPAPDGDLRALVRAAFAHRRKALARSVGLSGIADPARLRDALVELGQPADARAERLAPEEFACLWELVR